MLVQTGSSLVSEQVAQTADLGILPELGQVGEGHALTQFLQTLVGHIRASNLGG